MPGAKDSRKQLDGRLHASLGPAMRLLLEADHFGRKLGRGAELRQINELPSLHLCAVGKIEVFGEGVMLPPAGIVDCLTPPDSCRAVEVHESPAAIAGSVLDDEMPIEENRLALGQQRGIAI